MKNFRIAFFCSLAFTGYLNAQNIDLELFDPHPTLQDADVGDMEFVDVDNDGDMDLILSGKGGPILTTLYLNDGNGNFTEDLNDPFVNSYSGTVGVNDVDNDGDMDVLIIGVVSSAATTNLYINDGSGNFTSTPCGLLNAKFGDFAFGDVDNDGDDDLIMTGESQPDLLSPTFYISKLYLNDGTGNYTESTSNNFEPLVARVELFDADGDNDLDLIMFGFTDVIDRITLFYTNDGSGIFTEVTSTAFTDFNGGDIAIGDSDNDGDMDVLMCGEVASGDYETELYLNDGSGTFTLLPSTGLFDVALGEASFNDFDNDGDLDVFLIGTSEGGLGGSLGIRGDIFENTGSNNFVFSDSLIGGYISSHAVADIDGDTGLDLVLGGTTIGNPIRATWLYRNVTVGLNTEELSASNPLIVYPNPANNEMTIELELINDPNASLTLRDASGRTVKTITEFSSAGSTSSTRINTSNLPNGMYFVELVNTDKTVTKKVSISH